MDTVKKTKQKKILEGFALKKISGPCSENCHFGTTDQCNYFERTTVQENLLEYYRQCGTRTSKSKSVQVIIFLPLVILKENRW